MPFPETQRKLLIMSFADKCIVPVLLPRGPYKFENSKKLQCSAQCIRTDIGFIIQMHCLVHCVAIIYLEVIKFRLSKEC